MSTLVFRSLYRYHLIMDTEKKRIGVMLYDRLTQRITQMAEAAHMSPNELVNRFVEGCVAHVDQTNKPRVPVPMVAFLRTIFRRDYTHGDLLIQRILDEKVPDWKNEKESWRAFYVDLVQTYDGELTLKVLKNLKKQADELVRKERL